MTEFTDSPSDMAELTDPSTTPNVSHLVIRMWNKTVLQDDANNTEFTNGYIYKHPVGRAVFIMLCVCVAFLCIVGNLIVLFVIKRSRRMRTHTTSFLANLAVADFMVGVFCVIPFMSRYVYTFWILGGVVCKIWHYVEMLSRTTSIMFLQLIAIERYVAVKHPLKAKSLFTPNKMRIAMTLVWVFSALYNLPWLVMYKQITLKYLDMEKSYCIYPHKYTEYVTIYRMLMFFLWYLVPLLVMAILYVRICVTLHRSQFTQQMEEMRESVAQTTTDHGSSRAHSSSVWDQSNTDAQSDEPEKDRKCQKLLLKLRRGWKKRTWRRSVASNAVGLDGCCAGEAGERMMKKRYYKETTQKSATNAGSKTTQHHRSNCDLRTTVKLPRNYSYRSPKTDKNKPQTSGSQYHSREQLPVAQGGSAQRMYLGSFGSSSDSVFDHSIDDNSTHVTSQKSRSTIVRWPDASRQDQVGTPARSLLFPMSDNPINQNIRESASTSCIPTVSGGTTRRVCIRKTTQYKSRQRVIRLLIVVLLVFILLMFPFHIRNFIYVFCEQGHHIVSSFNFAAACYLLMYLNSGVNPILYGLLSQTFRNSLRETFCCRQSEVRVRTKRVREVESVGHTRHTSC